MPGDYQYFFHTYDNWAGNYAGVDVTIFWTNADAPDGTTGCVNADQVCISCQEETIDYDGDGAVGPVQGVYIGNFMHDFRHTSPSCVNVPIANSAGHVNGTVYTVTIYDENAQAVPIENIASHYSGHTITASGTDGASGASSATGTFDLHVGCNDFNGQFLYFSFCHSTEQEGSGWFSSVTASAETPQNCDEVPAPYVDPYATGGNTGYTVVQLVVAQVTQYIQDPYANGQNKQIAATGGRPNKRPNKNKNNKQRSEYDYDGYNNTQYYDDGQYYDNNDYYNYRK